ncbi:TRAP transporter permease [Alloiococcus sp. CFN-8]|uniref:TRAP transporter permease n=1 Tax=Alloiococcus sp. CFN-8 TaxID=3416081 RepID=UPI003CE93507
MEGKGTFLKKTNGIFKNIPLFVAIALCAFHTYTASIGILPGYALSSIHWGLVGTYIILTKPLKFKYGRILDILLMAANIFISVYLLKLQQEMIYRSGIYTQFEVYLSILSIICALVIAGRVLEKSLPIVSIIFIAYALLGNHIGGMFHTVKFSVSRIATYLYTCTDGLYGETLLVSAKYIFIFLVFGSVLEITGAGQFFVDLALSFTGRFRGGPAQASVYSSMLMGTISGSGAANVAATGPFTIPLMKKVGYNAEDSSAIASVAACGGQIMPPVMGAVAFLMSEITGVEYGKIALAAMIPGILYYVILSFIVYFSARKHNMEVVPESEMKKPFQVFKKGWLYLLPIIILAYMLFNGFSAQRSALVGIGSCLIIAFFINRSCLTISNFKKACIDSANGIRSIAGSCIIAGIVVGVLNITGLGVKLSGIIVTLSSGNLVWGLVLAMVASLILGLGLPTSASYLILAVMVGPALTEMGATIVGAHLFLLYFAALSSISPPVALTVFTASGIAGADNMKAGWLSMFYALGGIILPFMFVLNTNYLLEGSFISIAITLIFGVIGGCVLSAGIIGWFGTKLNLIARLLLLVAGTMIMRASMLFIILGLAIAAMAIVIGIIVNKKKQLKIEQVA